MTACRKRDKTYQISEVTAEFFMSMTESVPSLTFCRLNKFVPLPSENLADVSGQLKLIDQATNKLKRRKRRICRLTHGVSDSLSDALHYSMTACISLFKYERWNCSLDPSKSQLLQNCEYK